MGNENPWRRGDGSFSADWGALKRAREICMAREPQSSKWIGFSGCVRRFNYHRLLSLLRGGRKAAGVDELGSPRGRPGIANPGSGTHPSGKEDATFGSIAGPVAPGVPEYRESTFAVRYYESY